MKIILLAALFLSANANAQQVYGFVNATYIINDKEIVKLPKDNETIEGTIIFDKDGILRTMKKCYTDPVECSTNTDRIDVTGRVVKKGSSLLTQDGAKVRSFKGDHGKMIMMFEFEDDKNKIEGYEHWTLKTK